MKIILKKYQALLFITFLLTITAGCFYTSRSNTPDETGQASWYGKKFHGNKTASGELYDMFKYTAAHKTLPLGTIVEVTNLENGKKVKVTINDRGPFVKDRILDLSYAAAMKLGMVKGGTIKVKIRIIKLAK